VVLSCALARPAHDGTDYSSAEQFKLRFFLASSLQNVCVRVRVCTVGCHPLVHA
jgi:hypothetical protein